jgi:hypothetical protein
MEGSQPVARPCCPPRRPLHASPSMTKPPTANDPTNPLWELTLREAQWRRELGRRIHDDIVQVAVAARIKLDQLERRAPHLGTDDPTGDSPRDLLDHIRRSALEMCHELRAGDVRGALGAGNRPPGRDQRRHRRGTAPGNQRLRLPRGDRTASRPRPTPGPCTPAGGVRLVLAGRSRPRMRPTTPGRPRSLGLLDHRRHDRGPGTP